MIDLKELRIGNWVEYDDLAGNNSYKKITAKGLLEASKKAKQEENGENENDFYPIFLNDNILKKSGFIEVKEGWEIEINEYQKVQFRLMLPDGLNAIYKTFSSECIAISLYKCKYVHQLQNKLFFFTGKEFKIKKKYFDDLIIK